MDKVVEQTIEELERTKVLVAVKSCHEHRFIHLPILETWASAADHYPNVDVRFFVGTPTTEVLQDSSEWWTQKYEVQVDARDDYQHLTEKLYRILTYAVLHNYDYVFNCDTDTYVDLEKLVMAIPLGQDYVGNTGSNGINEAAHGGPGYWLSKHAIHKVLKLATSENIEKQQYDEWWVYDCLSEAGIHPTHDARYSLLTKPDYRHTGITYHGHEVRDPATLRAMFWYTQQPPMGREW